LSSWQSV